MTVEFFLFNTEGAISGLVAESVGTVVVHLVDLLDDGHRCRCGLGFSLNRIGDNNSSLWKSGDGANGQSQNLKHHFQWFQLATFQFEWINNLILFYQWKDLPRRFSLCVVGLLEWKTELNCCRIVTGFYRWTGAGRSSFEEGEESWMVALRIGEEKAKVGAITKNYLFFCCCFFFLSIFWSATFTRDAETGLSCDSISSSPSRPFSLSRFR